MKVQIRKGWSMLVVVGILLAACAPPTTPTPVEKPVEVTRIVEVTPTSAPPPTPALCRCHPDIA
jgi:hypothetical protein